MHFLKAVASSLSLSLAVACGSSSSGGDATTCGAGTALANGQCVPLQMCGAGTVSQNGTCIPGAGGGATMGAGGGSAAGAGGTGTGGAAGAGGIGTAGGADAGKGGGSGAGGGPNLGNGGALGTGGNYLRAKIDGVQFNSPTPMVVMGTSTVVVTGGDDTTERLSMDIWPTLKAGTVSCASGNIVMMYEIPQFHPGGPATFSADKAIGDCTLTVTAAGGRFQGAFSGTLQSVTNNKVIMVTDGAFDVPPP